MTDAGPRKETLTNFSDLDELDELAAPAPISPGFSQRETHLEERPQDEALDELAAPAPISPSTSHRASHLEDRPSTPSLTEKSQSPTPSPSRLETETYTIAYLILFSILGTLARLGLQALTVYPGAPIQTGIVWANVAGSMIMGFLSEDRMLFRQEEEDEAMRTNGLARTASHMQKHTATKKGLPLYIGLATGFCGSFTSFSAFMRDAFFALANSLPVPVQHPTIPTPSSTVIDTQRNVHRDGGYSLMALLTVLIANLGLSLGGLQVGAHVALASERWLIRVPALVGRVIFDRLAVLLAVGLWVGSIVMVVLPPDRPSGPVGNTRTWAQETWRSQALFSLVFAPLGCLLRFYVSLKLNGRIKSFPLGTFAVNSFGTVMEALFVDLQRVPVGGHLGCQILQGMEDGFCGCLTTVSTWVVEINGLRRRHGYVYAVSSIAVGLAFFVVISGSLLWTRGFKPLTCMT
ncbi:uncharacterized protein KY384_004830 [Bacidia gigantensis]|uniref:uncharacterized protein n=1 Tax=Bacidia gigantensis TaxID=2732470 RepID=UPI001D0522CA|nr:uncharacterized protein KY384_004830 [Bacidia gigantensis]KAG8530328.1 hypothetical protein KY384_004830 [Bacidia gigantensis]